MLTFMVCASDARVGDRLANLGAVIGKARQGVFVLLLVTVPEPEIVTGTIPTNTRQMIFHESDYLWII